MTWHLDPIRVLYLQTPAPSRCRTAVKSFRAEHDGLATIELAETPFYPQSGGQPADQGTIRWTSGSLEVCNAVYGTGGEVQHLGRLHGEPPASQSVAEAKINVAVRMMHARLHTAGELICAAVFEMGHDWPVSGAKHFPGDSRVVFRPRHPPVSLPEFRHSLAGKLDDLVAGDAPTAIKLLTSRAEAERYVIDLAELPNAANLYRIVIVHGEQGRPCTGTHVARLGEVGTILLRAVKTRKDQIVVSYDVGS